MKYIFTSVFVIFGLQFSIAQLTQANHAPANGEAYETWQCDSNSIGLGGSGAGQVWNFTTLTTHSSIVNSYSASTATNTDYPQANVFVSAGPSLNSYYKSSSSALEYYGGNVVVGNVAATLNYTTPLISAIYPMSLNSTTTSVTGGSINITAPLSVSGTFTGSALIYADASGTLNLPGAATYTDVIRVITSQTVDFVTFIGSGTLLQVSYEYFGGGIKPSLYTVTTSTAITTLGTFTQALVTRYKSAGTVTVSVLENNNQEFQYSVYPNPAKESVQFFSDNSIAAQIIISDITGKEIDSFPFLNGQCKVNVNTYNRGIYLYTIKNNTGKNLRTGKLIIID